MSRWLRKAVHICLQRGDPVRPPTSVRVKRLILLFWTDSTSGDYDHYMSFVFAKYFIQHVNTEHICVSWLRRQIKGFHSLTSAIKLKKSASVRTLRLIGFWALRSSVSCLKFGYKKNQLNEHFDCPVDLFICCINIRVWKGSSKNEEQESKN